MILPLPGETWQHFKGQRYEVVAIARHSETREELVIYQKAQDPDGPTTSSQPWARPLEMFMEPAQAKPTESGNYNCLHSAQDHYVVTVEDVDLMFCKECERGATVGRFLRVSKP